MALRPTPMMMQPPGMGGQGAGGPPRLPGSPMGGPGGPGGSPMVSPGSGAGRMAAATEAIKECIRHIQTHALAYQVGSKEWNAVNRGLSAFNPIFGKPSEDDLGPAARARMAQPPPSPLAGMAPPGMAGGQQGPAMGAPPPGMGPSEVGGGNPAFP